MSPKPFTLFASSLKVLTAAVICLIWSGGMAAEAVDRNPVANELVARKADDCVSQCITEYELEPLARPHKVVLGPDGALWFTMKGGQCETGGGNKIGRITADGVLNEYPIPTVPGYPGGLTVGPDQAMWFGEELGNHWC